MIDKNAKLKEVAPHIWSMYQHLMSVRSTLENRLNYFLAIDALLLIGFLQVFQSEVRAMAWEYLVPCFLLIVPILLLLANFLTKQMRDAWMEFHEHENNPPMLETIEKDEFYLRWIADIYSHAEGSWEYRKRIFKLLRVCLAFVAASLTWLCIALVWTAFYCSASEAAKSVLLSIGSVIVGVIVYIIPEQLKDFSYRDRTGAIREKLSKWLNKSNLGGNGRTDNTP
jgi:hypothetical protein